MKINAKFGISIQMLSKKVMSYPLKTKSVCFVDLQLIHCF